MEMFKIGNLDFTSFITVPSYVINQEDVYEEWKDGNGLNHRNVIRTKIVGSFNMLFTNTEDYFSFLDTLKNYKEAGGYTPVSLYINNLNEVRNADVYIHIAPANTLPYYGTSKNEGFEVTIEER